jgi:hypothetical protein
VDSTTVPGAASSSTRPEVGKCAEFRPGADGKRVIENGEIDDRSSRHVQSPGGSKENREPRNGVDSDQIVDLIADLPRRADAAERACRWLEESRIELDAATKPPSVPTRLFVDRGDGSGRRSRRLDHDDLLRMCSFGREERSDQGHERETTLDLFQDGNPFFAVNYMGIDRPGEERFLAADAPGTLHVQNGIRAR